MNKMVAYPEIILINVGAIRSGWYIHVVCDCEYDFHMVDSVTHQLGTNGSSLDKITIAKYNSECTLWGNVWYEQDSGRKIPVMVDEVVKLDLESHAT